MNNRIVVAVFDNAMEAYGQPQFVPHTAVAIRGFTSEVNRVDPQNMLNTNYGDFSLWHIADYDDRTGRFVAPESGPYRLVRAQDVLANAV